MRPVTTGASPSRVLRVVHCRGPVVQRAKRKAPTQEMVFATVNRTHHLGYPTGIVYMLLQPLLDKAPGLGNFRGRASGHPQPPQSLSTSDTEQTISHATHLHTWDLRRNPGKNTSMPCRKRDKRITLIYPLMISAKTQRILCLKKHNERSHHEKRFPAHQTAPPATPCVAWPHHPNGP